MELDGPHNSDAVNVYGEIEETDHDYGSEFIIDNYLF